MIETTSPLTGKPTKEKIPGTPYWKDSEYGLWFQEVESVTSPFDLPVSLDYSPEEAQASESLAKALFTNYMGNKPGPVLDIAPCELSLTTAFQKMDCPISEGLSNPKEKLSLVTFVHTFQKFQVKEASKLLKEIRESLAPDGTLFIRIPDNKVPGHEKDLTETHYKTAMTFWNLDSFLELLYQNPLFKIVETYTLSGGQRDYILKPIDKKPTMCAGLIAKNEERDLPICIKSLAGVVDGIVLIDTGSTDKTLEIAEEEAKKANIPLWSRTYLEASEKDEKGDWKLWDFSKARNQFVEQIDQLGFDYCLWMDSDDKLLSPKLKNLVFLDQYGIHAVQIQSGGIRWPHHRLWKANKGIKFSGRCHEYPAFNCLENIHDDITVFHDAAPGTGENSNSRNLRILEKEVLEAPTPRNCFYLGNTYKDGGKHAEAVGAYQKRIDFGKGYEDEYWFAVLYKARCEFASGKIKESRSTLLKAVAERPDWAEFWMELCYGENKQGNNKKALGYALLAQDIPVAPTRLFREKDKYIDQPYRMASWTNEHLKDFEQSLKYALLAREKIGGPDKDWDSRIERLQIILGKKPEVAKTVCWHRPGALGDVLMTLNLVKKFKEKNPNTKLFYKCAPSISNALSHVMLQAGVDSVITTDMKTPVDKEINLIGYPLAEGYPHKPMEKHLIEYFAKEVGVEPSFDDLELELPTKKSEWNLPEKYVTLHIKSGWSPYKDWKLERWEQVCDKLKRVSIPVFQIGGPDDPVLKGVAGSFLGSSFKDSLAILANASMHMGIDSWSNHATNITWADKGKVPAVILWGSTQYQAAGYKHNANISAGLPCQPCFREDPKISRMSLGVCPNPVGQTYENPMHQCMKEISVNTVVEEAIKIWVSVTIQEELAEIIK